MNLPYEALLKLMSFVQWVVKEGLDENCFAENVMYALKPYYQLRATMEFCEDQITVSIPFALAMDINSVVLKHGDHWNVEGNN